MLNRRLNTQNGNRTTRAGTAAISKKSSYVKASTPIMSDPDTTNQVQQIKQFAKNIRDIPLTKVDLAADPDGLAAGLTAEEAVDKLNRDNLS